ncbi:MAG: 6-phospho-beta-glucosidase [Anaerolineaceae bacterium]|nr:6-phospho-beta-glucosidase [Anaerolineaceae bacterium]
MKITVIGGGSTYTPELVQGLIKLTPDLPLKELWLMDIDRQRLDVVGGFVQRMVCAAGNPFKVTLSQDQRASIENADYIISQLRVGQMQARREDEYLGLRHGLIGQETTGIGGMAKALRTIPVVLNIAKDIQELAPNALLLNFTNPAGLITEALSRYAPKIQSVGVCNVGITAKMSMLEGIKKLTGNDIPPANAQLDTLGLNHLTWHRGFKVSGNDIWSQIFPAYLEELRTQDEPEWNPMLLENLGMIPNYYLHYFYNTRHKLEEQQKWPPSRAEEVLDIEKDLLAQFADPDLISPPEDLMKRGGAWYSTLATEMIFAHYADLNAIHVVNLPHRGAVPGWPQDWVLEMPALINRQGIHPIPSEPLPPAQFGLISAVKMFELLTVEAAVHADRRSAYLALLAHPLGPQADQIQIVLDDLLNTHQAYLPQFFNNAS